jgi:uncharacterized protein YdaU (DUF1376 family)
MALRDQPYFPLYVQDFLTDEKLNLCSAESTGVYIRLLCILHKQEDYGQILLKQNAKQNGNQYDNFATMLSKQMPYKKKQISRSLLELSEENVIEISGNLLKQKRMIKDGEISKIRSLAGKRGGDKNIFAQANLQAKSKQNTEYEYENENTSVSKIEDETTNLKKNLKKKTKL